jgi:hypothetical protein
VSNALIRRGDRGRGVGLGDQRLSGARFQIRYGLQLDGGNGGVSGFGASGGASRVGASDAVLTGASGWIAATVRSGSGVSLAGSAKSCLAKLLGQVRSTKLWFNQVLRRDDRKRRRRTVEHRRGDRTSVGATVLTANRRSYITGTAARPRRASLSAAGVPEVGAACPRHHRQPLVDIVERYGHAQAGKDHHEAA